MTVINVIIHRKIIYHFILTLSIGELLLRLLLRLLLQTNE